MGSILSKASLVVPLLVLVFAVGFLSEPTTAEAQRCTGQGGSWVQEANPWTDMLNSSGDPNINHGFQQLYNAWNATHDNGWTYTGEVANVDDGDCGGLLDTDPTGVIFAVPNPCQITAGNTTCTSYVSWVTNGVGEARVFRGNASGGNLQPFSTGLTGANIPATDITTTASTFVLYSYSLGVQGAELDRETVVGIAAPQPPTATLTPEVSTVAPGGSQTLTWGSTNANTCTGNGFSTGGAVSGSVSVTPAGNTNYSVSCTGDGGIADAYATVNVAGNPNLVVSAASVPGVSKGANVPVFATVTNTGGGTTGSAFTTTFTINGNSAGTANSATTNAGQSRQVVSSNYKFTSAGTYTIVICTDSANQVAETNESDNCSESEVSIPEMPPSSSVTCSVDQASVAPGGTVTYTAHPSVSAGPPYVWTAADGATGFGSKATAARTFSADATGTYSMQVTAKGASNTGYCPNVTVAANWCTGGSADLTITATPNRVRSGTTVAVSWSASGINGADASCSVSGPGVSWSSSVSDAPSCSASGSASPVITTQSTYTLTCGGLSESVTVNVIPNVVEF